MTFENEFNNWISDINSHENPSKDIIAFWFGLFETENGFTMYLIGSKEFAENDDDWTCNEDFEPKDKYLNLPNESTTGRNFENVLEDSIDILRAFLESNDFKTSIFSSSIAIAIGFDDGDLIRIK